jgi:endonuclease YncB( thermonuclease family)
MIFRVLLKLTYVVRTAAAVALLFALVVQAVAAPPATTSGKVVSVHDVDTVTVRTDDGQTLKVRLQGIDAPELKQAFGSRSRDELSALVKGKPVTLVDHGRDKYGRTLANVMVDGVDANARQVATGMAWHYARFDKSAGLARAQADAKAAKRGLWGDAAPVAPWEWRSQEQARRKASRGLPAGAGSK